MIFRIIVVNQLKFFKNTALHLLNIDFLSNQYIEYHNIYSNFYYTISTLKCFYTTILVKNEYVINLVLPKTTRLFRLCKPQPERDCYKQPLLW